MGDENIQLIDENQQISKKKCVETLMLSAPNARSDARQHAGVSHNEEAGEPENM